MSAVHPLKSPTFTAPRRAARCMIATLRPVASIISATVTPAPHPQPLPTGGRGAPPAHLLCATATAKRLPPPRVGEGWGGGHATSQGLPAGAHQ